MQEKQLPHAATPHFDAFLSATQKTGALKVQQVRASGPSHEESYLHRLIDELTISQAGHPVHVEVESNAHPGVEKGNHSALAANLISSHWALLANQGNLALFAGLHDAGHHSLSELLAKAPGNGGHIAGAAIMLAKGIPTSIVRSVDSVLFRSYADAYAVLLRASVDGRQVAITMAEGVIATRIASGDCGRFSACESSYDTKDAVGHAIAFLKLGEPIPTEGRAFCQVILNIAIQGTAAWLQGQGVSRTRAQALSNFVQEIAQSFAANARAGAILAPQTFRPVFVQ